MKTSTSRIFRTPVFVTILATGVWVLVSGCAVRVPPLSRPDPTDPMAEIGAESPYRPDLSAETTGSMPARCILTLPVPREANATFVG